MDPEDDGPVDAETISVPASPGTAADPATSRPGAGLTASAAERIAALRARLISPMPDDRLWGWIWPLIITAFAGYLRFSRLSVPNAIMLYATNGIISVAAPAPAAAASARGSTFHRRSIPHRAITDPASAA